MTTSRIKDLTSTETLASDDYLVANSATEGTRKILFPKAFPLSFETEASFSAGPEKHGLYNTAYAITPYNVADITDINLALISAYFEETATGSLYPLEVTACSIATSTFNMNCKCHCDNIQSTTSSYLGAGKLHVIAPFAIKTITVSM